MSISGKRYRTAQPQLLKPFWKATSARDLQKGFKSWGKADCDRRGLGSSAAAALTISGKRYRTAQPQLLKPFWTATSARDRQKGFKSWGKADCDRRGLGSLAAAALTIKPHQRFQCSRINEIYVSDASAF